MKPVSKCPPVLRLPVSMRIAAARGAATPSSIERVDMLTAARALLRGAAIQRRPLRSVRRDREWWVVCLQGAGLYAVTRSAVYPWSPSMGDLMAIDWVVIEASDVDALRAKTRALSRVLRVD
jgi:hypothetical protein